MELGEYISKESEFLHDVSNQLVVARACSSFLMNSLSPKIDQLTEKDLDKLTKLNVSVEKMIDKLRERKKTVSENRENL